MSAFTIDTSFEGNLVADLVLRETSAHQPVANGRIAVTSRSRVGANDFVDKTEYVNIVLWGDMAVNAAMSVSKGDRVLGTGQYRERRWKGEDGATRYTPEIHADSFGVSLRWHVVTGVEKQLKQAALAEATA